MDELSTQNKPNLPLEDRLSSVSDSERSTLMALAKLVRVSMSLREATNDNSMTYIELINKMYGSFPLSKRTLVAEILDQTNPLPPRVAKPEQQSRQDRVVSLYDSDEMQVVAKEPTTAADNAGFLERLTQSESSGDSKAEITIADGRRYVGALQFGDARLQDYKKATGSSFTQDEFKANTVLQDKVASWHIADIDKTIDGLGLNTDGYDRDGLRAVAHLGGKGGMKNFVRSKGQYNPKDQLGTSLQDYYDKFVSS